MKQNDRQDLEEIAEAINLPERAVEEIQNYTLPEHQIGKEKASYMMVYAVRGDVNSCGTAKIKASKELVYAASSNGEVFDDRISVLLLLVQVVLLVVALAMLFLMGILGPPWVVPQEGLLSVVFSWVMIKRLCSVVSKRDMFAEIVTRSSASTGLCKVLMKAKMAEVWRIIRFQ